MFLSRRGKLVFVCLLLAVAGGVCRQWRVPAVAAQSVLQGAAAINQLKQDGQYDSLQAAMQQARLQVSRETATPLGRWAWHAPNPAAGYDAYVTEAGVSLVVGQDGILSHGQIVSLHLRSLGYGAALHGVAAGEVNGDKQSITIERGKLHEWFVNTADGLEHGFTLDEPPPSAIRNPQSAIPLRLALQVSEGWQAVADDGGQRVNLRNEEGQAIEYGKLVVRDARGKFMPASLTVEDAQVVIEAEDHDAVYPLTIDPLFTLQQKLTAAEGEAGDLFGTAVALSGDTAVIGAPGDDVPANDEGSVYVFTRRGAVWTLQQKLVANDGLAGDYFGYAVALSGDTVVVGAHQDDSGANADQGAAYVFTRSGTLWTLQQKLAAGDGAAGDHFGFSVAVSDDTVVAGAYFADINGNLDEGAAYVFTRSGTSWTQQRKLIAGDGSPRSYFGNAVAVSGDTVVVGGYNHTVEANAGQGSAYVFTRSGTRWTQQQRLLASDGAGLDYFGRSVALSGDTVVVGADNDTVLANAGQGSAYVFTRSGTLWTQQQKLIAADGAAGDQFGTAVALSGDALVVGADFDKLDANAQQGSAYVFTRNGTLWTQQQKLSASDGAVNDFFGNAVALNGDTVVVGAWSDDVGANWNQGSAHGFVLRADTLLPQQSLAANDGVAGDRFGWSIALGGETAVVGAPFDDFGAKTEQGSVYVFTRSGTNWTFQQKLFAGDGQANDYFGAAVALSGDTLVVGAHLSDIGAQADQGAAYVFTRSGTVWTLQQKLFAADGAVSDFFGYAVALSGDTVLVGAQGVNLGPDLDRGAAYVFTRSGTNWTQQQKLFADLGAARDAFGCSVALSDGIAVIGALGFHNFRKVNQGAAYVFTRSGTSWTQQRELTASDGAPFDEFGTAVALSGNTVAVGAPNHRSGVPALQGAVYVFTIGVWREQKLLASDGAANDFFGYAVALSGDLLAVGAYGDTLGTNANQGSAYLFKRSATDPTGWTRQQKLSASDGAAEDNFGYAIALGGDTLMVGARGDTVGGNANQGSAYVFALPACSALSLNPATLPNGVVNTAYSQTVTATSIGSGTETHQFSFSDGTLPPGLTLTQNGVLSGTPTTAGTYRFTLTATALGSLCPGSRSYTVTITAPNNNPTIALVSAASYLPGAAPDSMVAAFGAGLSTTTQAASSVPLPTQLAGVSARVRDSQGVERLAPLFFVSPGQINLLIPAATALGAATVTLTTGGMGTVEIKRTAPGLFAANANGQGIAAAVLLRVRANGAQSYEAVTRFDGTRFVAVPINFGAATDQLILVLYGSGIRLKQTAAAQCGGANAEVLYAGESPGFAGLDQVNVRLPRTMQGGGSKEMTLNVDGAGSNKLLVEFQ